MHYLKCKDWKLTPIWNTISVCKATQKKLLYDYMYIESRDYDVKIDHTTPPEPCNLKIKCMRGRFIANQQNTYINREE